MISCEPAQLWAGFSHHAKDPAHNRAGSQLTTIYQITYRPRCSQVVSLAELTAQVTADIGVFFAIDGGGNHLAAEFLTRLHHSHRDVVMVTNAHRKTLDIKMEEVDITHWFDRVVVSHDLQAPKEDQDFWHKLQELHPFQPSRTLLIDDTEQVLASAQHYGIAHLLTLLQPDSSRQLRIDTRFKGIHHFDEIMPGQISL